MDDGRRMVGRWTVNLAGSWLTLRMFDKQSLEPSALTAKGTDPEWGRHLERQYISPLPTATSLAARQAVEAPDT